MAQEPWQKKLLETLTRLDSTMTELRQEFREVRTELKVLGGRFDGFLQQQGHDLESRVRELEEWRRNHDPHPR